MSKAVSGKSTLLNILVAVMMTVSSGCVYLVIGGLGALGGYVVSPDTVEGYTSLSEEDLWDEAVNVISIMGVISEKKEDSGIILAKVQGAKVTATIQPVGTASVKITIKARKAFFPKIRIAQDIYIKIMSNLQE